MSLRHIGPWLLEQEAFQRELNKITLDAVRAQFLLDDMRSAKEAHPSPPDWSRLLLSAGFLAQSDATDCQEAALRIAQACLESGHENRAHRDAAAVILDKLANRAAITLAERRNLVSPDVAKRLPFPLRLEWSRNEAERAEVIAGERVYLNRFQMKLLSAMNENRLVSASAPTAAGKSFLLIGWVIDYVTSRRGGLVVYVVPTRALISEIEQKLRLRAGETNDSINVTSLPSASAIRSDRPNVLVLTQERLQILLANRLLLAVDLVVVDEAHKIGDGHRGVLLQQVLESVNRLSPSAKVVYASPLTSNPDIFLTDLGHDHLGASVLSNDVTVNQNIIWVSQVPLRPQKWVANLVVNEALHELGRFSLQEKPSSDRKRIAFVAHALAGASGGNLVYANGPADAEKCADLIGQVLSPPSEGEKAELEELSDLVKKVVHPKYALASTVRKGVGFHYGNMPLILRSEIERLFGANKLKYLVCTSTLIEGVNLSCRNIFVRGPKKGRMTRMKSDDFWNLAGRAGRWGAEFQGNVICIDPGREDVWGAGGAPRSRKLVTIRRATDEAIRNPEELLQFIENGTPRAKARARPDLEAVTSYLVAEHFQLGSIALAGWARRLPIGSIEKVAKAIGDRFSQLEIPLEIIQRNPGISPLAMESLLEYFRTEERDPTDFLIADPNSDDAVQSYTAVFGRIQKTLGGSIAPVPSIGFWRALLVTRWMRGVPLARLVDARLKYSEGKGYSVSASIRAVLEDVEQIARFEAPRLLAAYKDVLSFYLGGVGKLHLMDDAPDVALYLEFGASQLTQISLMSMGLSRSTAIELADLIARDDLDQVAAAEWLKSREWELSDLPDAMVREIGSVVPIAPSKILDDDSEE